MPEGPESFGKLKVDTKAYWCYTNGIVRNKHTGDLEMEIKVTYKHYRYPNEIYEMYTYGVNREAAENQAFLELGISCDIIEIEEVLEETA